MIDQRTAPWAALLLRVTLGSLSIAHLYWKFAILPGGLNTWWSNFAAKDIPPSHLGLPKFSVPSC
jgi:putative oxidoreductase